MTIQPSLITGFPQGGHPYTNITPFTYRDGLTYAGVLEALREYIRDVLVPFVDTQVGGLAEAWDAEVTALVTAVNTALAEQATNVDEALEAQNEGVSLVVAAMYAYVDEQVENIVNDSVEVTDPMMRDLINNIASLTRVALDALYQPKNTVHDASVAALLNTATTTRTAFDARYVTDTDAAATVHDVAHGGTGRNTGGTANGVIVAGTTATGAQQTVAPGTAGHVLRSAGAGAPPAFGELINDASTAADRVFSAQKSLAIVAASSLRGTYAARPAATSVPSGTTYAATDVPELYYSNGAAWFVIGSGGNELGYAQFVANITTTGARVNIAALTVPFTVGERPIEILVQAQIRNDQANGLTVMYIMLDGVQVGQVSDSGRGASNFITLNSHIRKAGLTPGSAHTLTVDWQAGGGTSTIEAMATNVPFATVRTL